MSISSTSYRISCAKSGDETTVQIKVPKDGATPKRIVHLQTCAEKYASVGDNIASGLFNTCTDSIAITHKVAQGKFIVDITTDKDDAWMVEKVSATCSTALASVDLLLRVEIIVTRDKIILILSVPYSTDNRDVCMQLVHSNNPTEMFATLQERCAEKLGSPKPVAKEDNRWVADFEVSTAPLSHYLQLIKFTP